MTPGILAAAAEDDDEKERKRVIRVANDEMRRGVNRLIVHGKALANKRLIGPTPDAAA
jgi:hypothetical protein